MLTRKQTTKKKRKPYTAASFTLMSSEHKLLLLANSTIIEIDATNICATSSIVESDFESATTESKYNKRSQQKPHYNCSSANRRSSSASTSTTKSRRHQCSTYDGTVKPKSIVLTHHLVNSLMTLLYFIAFVSLSTYPVYVSAVGKYHTHNTQLSNIVIISNSRKSVAVGIWFLHYYISWSCQT